jgi:FkbM family methyltransferase
MCSTCDTFIRRESACLYSLETMTQPLDDSGLSRMKRMAGMATAYRSPLKAYRHRFTRGRSELVVHELRGGPRFEVDAGPADVRIINEIWIGHCYEGHAQTVPRDGWSVVDLGAHKGIYAARILHLAPEAVVHCYEPDPHNYACLVRNVPTAHHHPLAVGSTSGTSTLQQVPSYRGLSSTVEGRLGSRGTPTVPVEVARVSLAQVIEHTGRVDLLKIDVEGAEYDIVLNSDPRVFARVARVVMEYDAVHPRDSSVSARHLSDRLRHVGYQVDEGRHAVAKGYGSRIMTAWRP